MIYPSLSLLAISINYRSSTLWSGYDANPSIRIIDVNPRMMIFSPFDCQLLEK